MSHDLPVDSHESESMARPVSSAEVDGWEVESSSAIQPTNKELADRLMADAESAGKDEAGAEPPEPVNEDLDDAMTDDETAPAVEAHPKKRKLTAAERKGVLQAEFNALTRQREEARRAFEVEEAERGARRAASLSDPPQEAASATEATTGEPDWDEYEADGKSFTQFQKDHSKWLRETVSVEATVRANAAAEERIAVERGRAADVALAARHEARLEQIHAVHPDFTEVVEANLNDVEQTPFMRAVVVNHPQGLELLYHLAQRPHEAKILATLPMTRPIMDAVKASSDPVPLLSYFAQHQDEHARIAYLDPASALLALGRLLSDLSGPGAKNGSPAPTPPVTTAKPPIRPLGATRSAGVSRDDDDDLEFGPEYVRRERERQLQRHASH